MNLSLFLRFVLLDRRTVPGVWCFFVFSSFYNVNIVNVYISVVLICLYRTTEEIQLYIYVPTEVILI